MASEHGRRGETGMTLVEVAMSCVLITAIIAFTMTSMAAVVTVGRSNEARSRAQGSHRSLIAQLREELSDCTTDPDPITNQDRYQILTDGEGRQSLRVQKLTGARMASSEVVALWSDWVTWSVDGDGIVRRSEGTGSRIIATGILDLRFAVTANGRFEIICVTNVRDGSRVVEHTYREWVTPRI